jgi:hypothetical protein
MPEKGRCAGNYTFESIPITITVLREKYRTHDGKKTGEMAL